MEKIKQKKKRLKNPIQFHSLLYFSIFYAKLHLDFSHQLNEVNRMEPLKYRSVFDIIGPIMVGPSSSHTAGAARIGKIVRHIFWRTA